MPTNRKMRGETVNVDSPNWGPLEELLGLDLTARFMWMHEIELRNRTRIHAYKHKDTRAYLHLTRDGRCYAFEPVDSYRQISQYQALNVVYRFWAGSRDPEARINLLTARERAVLSFVRDHASHELLEPGQKTALLAGPTPGDLFRVRWDALEDEDWSSGDGDPDGGTVVNAPFPRAMAPNGDQADADPWGDMPF